MPRYLFPEVIAVTLYKYNSIDGKLYTLICNECKIKQHQDTILVKKEDVTVIMVTHSIEEAALISDEVLVTGLAPINVIKKFNPPKCKSSVSWQKLGLRKSLEDKSFVMYLKLIRDTSYKALQKETQL